MPKCLYCENEFKYRFRSTEKFCSTKCCHDYHNGRRKLTANKVCAVCGKEITGQHTKYCSSECRYKAQIERQRNRYEKEYKSTLTETEEKQKKKRGRPRKRLSIADINQLAREEGLNYGQYVAKYGL